MRSLTLTVTDAQAGRTVQSLMRRELQMADGLISSLKFRPDGITKNGARVRVTARVEAGDVLRFDIADRGENAAAPLDLPLPIVWEDEYLAILDKPAGVSLYGAKAPNISGILAKKWGSFIKFHPVNRLDVGTSGLMIAAKDGYTHDRLRRLLHTDDFLREYIAVAQGGGLPPFGTVDLPLSRQGVRTVVDPGGKLCRTEYDTLAETDGRTLLRLRLCTGRTHQIRAHMAALSHPLVGDPLYGATDLALTRPALHSHRIRLRHPATGDWIDVSAPLPEDMEAIIKKFAHVGDL